MWAMDFPLIVFDPETGVASVGIPSVIRPVRGIKKLVQVVVLALLKNGGQDVLTPDEGSGVRSLIGQFNYSDTSEIKIEVLRRIRKVEAEILANQEVVSLPADEKLRELKIMSVVSDPANGNTAVSLQVINEAGQSTTVVV
jgi:hypothetical protein